MIIIQRLVLCTLFLLGLSAFCAYAAAAENQPQGQTFYVSKLGDNSDGRSWKTAFHAIQTALSAVPDDKGGHRVIVRPDTYVEANLYPGQKGAPGAYNLLIGDANGSLGSGATGRIVIDASCPGVAVRRDGERGTFEIVQSDLPESGFKAVDWWAPILSTNIKAKSANGIEQTFGSFSWDRWILRNLYVTGGDAGLFWDGGMMGGFTVIVEDCVGIGRAFGGGVCYPVVRPNEPSIFRRCYFLALDFDRDTAAVLVGGSEKTMPAQPHLVLEDCTLVHPDNALATSYASHCVRVKLVDCRLIVLNFTQPDMGGNSTGILCTEGPRTETRKLHVDLEDCILAGYSVFTPGADAKDVTYTTQGKVQAYVQFRQTLPEGFERLGLWPIELFDRIEPPKNSQIPVRAEK